MRAIPHWRPNRDPCATVPFVGTMSSAFEGLERHTMAESLSQQIISDPRGVSRPTHCRFRRQAR